MKDDLQAAVSPLGSQKEYIYVLSMCRHQGQWLFTRHRDRTTWEGAGGHIEPGETPLQAAKRELYEETGALEYTITPVGDYSAAGTHGVFFFADIAQLAPLPESEMAEVRLFSGLPAAEQLTYPGIIPVVFRAVQAWLAGQSL